MTQKNDIAQAGLSRYMDTISKYAHLEADDERRLASSASTGCNRSRDKLINAHLKLAVKVAMRYRGYGYPLADMISEANIGLIRAVDKFNPEKGARLATYAMLWIHAQIMDKVRADRSIVRVGEHRDRAYVPDQSLNDVMLGGESRLDMMESPDDSPEDIVAASSQHRHQKGILGRLMARLNEKQRVIVQRRLLSEDPPSLEEMGAEYGVSKEAIRQQEAKAWDKMRRAAGVTG